VLRSARRRPWFTLFVAVLLIENAWLVYPYVRDLVLQKEESEAARGRRLAAQLGCFSCHGPGGRGGVPNLGSQWETVPSFHEGAPMMFVGSDDDIRAYILDGAPAAKRQRKSYQEEMDGQAIHMPAYRDWISTADVDDLVAMVRAASDLLDPPDELAKRGAEVVRKSGCFTCHGDFGTGGVSNPGSFKGYIPSFLSTDFHELVRSEAELRGWIREGSIPRLRDDPLAGFFLRRQRIQMPAFGKFLSDQEVEAAAAYVKWLAAGTWQRQALHSGK
jgi:mono/diheme cytochrome c family protein